MLLEEEDEGVDEEVRVALLAEAVALVAREQVPGRAAVLADGGDDLIGLARGDAE